MSEVFPKYIIEDDRMTIGKATFHKDLALDINNIKGGGWWIADHVAKTITLTGDSHDFGKAKLVDVISAILNDKVFTDKYQRRNHFKEYAFFWRDELGDVTEIK